MRSWAAAVLLAATAVAGCDRGDHPEQIGRKAPVFAVSDGQSSVDLGKLRGQVVVLNFWASWCGPCVEEMPSLEELQRQLPQVKIVAVSTDEDAAAYERFLQQHSISLMTVRDAAQRSNAMYGTFRYPETYVIDKTGMIRRKFIGAQQWTSPEIVGFLKKLSS
ncbi:MAG TPA: TlpA disulfide reductase family protein [Acidobacteriaceae bacterium]|jgi:thiol-disulfide isomerase/thioredoxin|nr:TlpA disulfide reductase family protein [Acidobacteriaceae bacterium]